jgi:hypothetical protein
VFGFGIGHGCNIFYLWISPELEVEELQGERKLGGYARMREGKNERTLVD